MHLLKKLKSQVDLKKLITFLNLYKYLIFYHCRKAHKVAPPHSSKVLFQILRVRKVASQTKSSQQKLESYGKIEKCYKHKQTCADKVTSPVGAEKQKRRVKAYPVQEILSSIAKAGTTGSTILVGCDSLENMQKCIANLHSDGAWVSLGAIYETVYIDPKDCLQLAQLNRESLHRELIYTVSRGPELLLHQCLSPLVRLLRVSASLKLHNKPSVSE